MPTIHLKPAQSSLTIAVDWEHVQSLELLCKRRLSPLMVTHLGMKASADCDVCRDVQISRKASKLRSPLLHAMFGSDEWEVLMLEAVLPDGGGLTKRTSLLAPPAKKGALKHRA